MIGIYKIENQVNGKIYIGQSINIEQRWYNHRNELNGNRHCNRHLQNSWNKHGEKNFKFEIIEECTLDNIDEKEIYWISYYNSTNIFNGYNISSGGNASSRGVKLTQEQKEYMSKVKNPEEIVQIDFNGNIVKIWRSATHAQRTLGIRACSILKCARQDGSYQANGYFWFFAKIFDIDNFNVELYKYNHRRYLETPILQYDLYGNFIKEWSGINEIKNNSTEMNCAVIRSVCEHRGKNTYNGYIWIYKYDDNYEINEKLLLKCQLKYKKCIVEQYNKNGVFLKEWNTEELEKSEYNYDIVHRNCCNSYKSVFYKDCIWKYKGDNSKNIKLIVKEEQERNS